MELSASVFYGIPLTQDTAEELINATAVYEAVKELPELKYELDDYFEVYDDDEEIDVSYPAEIIGRIAELHPTYKGRLNYMELGNTASVDDDDSVIMIFIDSTFQEVESFGPLSPILEPSAEDIQLMYEFMSRFLNDVSEVPAPEWILGASGS